jgi:hypothetical protein
MQSPEFKLQSLKKRKKKTFAGCQWLTPLILATQEAEIRRITIQSQPRQIVHKTLSGKNPSHIKKRAGGVASGVGPKFKPQYYKTKLKKEHAPSEFLPLGPAS